MDLVCKFTWLCASKCVSCVWLSGNVLSLRMIIWKSFVPRSHRKTIVENDDGRSDTADTSWVNPATAHPENSSKHFSITKLYSDELKKDLTEILGSDLQSVGDLEKAASRLLNPCLVLYKAPYARTLDGKPVIVKVPVWDEIVIEIGVKNTHTIQKGGPRGNRFEFTLVEYAAILIENLTHPDRKFEYE